MQKDMLDILQAEGFNINDRELLRLRLRFQWLLRESRSGAKKGTGNGGGKRKNAGPDAEEDEVADQLPGPIPQEDSDEEDGDDGLEEAEAGEVGADFEPLDPEEATRRQIRLEQLQIESAEKWRTRKRRRRTRGWAGLPADAPGEPPRFPSETTLDESKAYLRLDNTLYRQVREQFQEICEEEGVLKKTLAGPDKWSQLKHRLIQRSAHLSTVFDEDPEARQQIGTMPTPNNFKALSLDVICTDVTKRMRVVGNSMGLPQAKNVLGLNPAETREVRKAFHAILKADHFTNKYESGEEHWNALKDRWIRESDLLVRVLANADADPNHTEKIKAIEVVARDVMKRLRAENCAKDPSKKKQINVGPGPGPAHPKAGSHQSQAGRKAATGSAFKKSSVPSTGADAQLQALDISALAAASDLQIDPSLLLAASDPSMIPDHMQVDQETATNLHSHQSMAPTQHNYIPQAQPPPQHFLPTMPLPIYFRLHPHSTTTLPSKTVWLGILQSGTVSEVSNLAMREHPGTVVVKVEGLVVHKMMQGGQGQDRGVAFAIDDDDELAAYLEHVSGNGGKATFVVLLAMNGQQQAQGGFV